MFLFTLTLHIRLHGMYDRFITKYYFMTNIYMRTSPLDKRQDDPTLMFRTAVDEMLTLIPFMLGSLR